MKKKMMQTLSAALATLLTLGMGVACGGDGFSEDSVVIYIEYNGLAGADDDKVKEALEKGFETDTGKSIDLVLELCSTSMIGQKVVNALGSSDKIDAIISHYSSDSTVTDMITQEKELKDITELVKTYAPDVAAMYNAETDPNNLALHKGVYNGKLYALSSLERNSSYGMLVNKALMATSSFDPEEYDIANEGYKSLTLDEFTQMLREIKEVYEKANPTEIMRPLGGSPWDIEYFLLPVFEHSSYIHYVYKNDICYPAYADENNQAILEYERLLQTEKLWYENPTDSTIAERDFYAGKNAVYIAWPEATSQITLARELKESCGDDCIMLAPLKKDAETETNGNARLVSGFLGMVVPNKGENTELLLEFMNWMYSSKDNYELAKYGIKGEHWIETEAVNGYETYAYPADKKATYEKTPAYSGVYNLLNNIYLSDKIYSGYTETEQAWLSEVYSFKSYPANGYDDEGINLPGVGTDRTLNKQSSKIGTAYTTVRKYAWSEANLPTDKTIASLHAELRALLTGDAKDYVAFLTEGYERELQSRQTFKLEK